MELQYGLPPNPVALLKLQSLNPPDGYLRLEWGLVVSDLVAEGFRGLNPKGMHRNALFSGFGPVQGPGRVIYGPGLQAHCSRFRVWIPEFGCGLRRKKKELGFKV